MKEVTRAQPTCRAAMDSRSAKRPAMKRSSLPLTLFSASAAVFSASRHCAGFSACRAPWQQSEADYGTQSSAESMLASHKADKRRVAHSNLTPASMLIAQSTRLSGTCTCAEAATVCNSDPY